MRQTPLKQIIFVSTWRDKRLALAQRFQSTEIRSYAYPMVPCRICKGGVNLFLTLVSQRNKRCAPMQSFDLELAGSVIVAPEFQQSGWQALWDAGFSALWRGVLRPLIQCTRGVLCNLGGQRRAGTLLVNRGCTRPWFVLRNVHL